MSLNSHYNFKVKWIDFPFTNRKVQGVYMIGDCVYIGASMHIRSRIISHLNLCKRMKHENKMLQDYYIYCDKNNLPIEVKRLDENPLNEKLHKVSNCVKMNYNERFFHQNKKFREMYLEKVK